jgi:hypothetical protein
VSQIKKLPAKLCERSDPALAQIKIEASYSLPALWLILFLVS